MRVTIAQLDAAPADIAGAEALIEGIFRMAAPTDLLVLPELALCGFGRAEEVMARAIGREGPEMRRLADLACRYRTALAFGYAERDADGVYNSAAVITADGHLCGHFRKMHLWSGYEQALFQAGAPAPVFSLSSCRIGILICYDLDFQEAARDLVLRGADTLLVLSGTTSPYSVIAEALVPARAYENGCNVIFADRGGADGDFTFLGRSRIAGPDGGLIAATDEEGFALVCGEISTARVAAWRAAHPNLADRRRDLFPDPPTLA